MNIYHIILIKKLGRFDYIITKNTETNTIKPIQTKLVLLFFANKLFIYRLVLVCYLKILLTFIKCIV